MSSSNENSTDQDELGNSSLANMPRTGRPSTYINPANKENVDTLIRADKRINIEELA